MLSNYKGVLTQKDIYNIKLGLMEIIYNAIEHGNLNISYEEKTNLIKNNIDFHEYCVKKAKEKEFRDKKVIVETEKINNDIIFIVKDEGNGFDVKEISDFHEKEKMKYHGYGLKIISNIFSEIKYLENGNVVYVRYNIGDRVL